MYWGNVLRCDTHGVLALADQSLFVIVPLWSHCDQFKGVGSGTELTVRRFHFTTRTACQVHTTNRILCKTQGTDLLTYYSDLLNILMKSNNFFLPCVFHHQDMSNRRCSTLRGHTISYARLQSHWRLQTWSINCDTCQCKFYYYVKARIWLKRIAIL